jgi:drug/metabolite transporter (DMT)-like permease
VFVAFFVFTFLPPDLSDTLSFTGQEWFIMLILGVVQMGLGYAFYNTGVSRTSPQKASVIALWELILGPVWVALFLHEYPSLMLCIGFVIIIAGIIMDAKVDSPAKS